MPYSRPTLQEIITRNESDIKTRIEKPETLLNKSVFKILSAVFGGSEHLLYDFIEFVKQQLFITTADEEMLEKHGAEYGIYRSIGVKATGSATVTGTNGIVISADSELQTSTGNKYKVDTAVTIAGGTGTLDLTASETGAEYNEASGVILTFLSPISGCSATATIDSSGITGGVDADTKEGYRSKILNRKKHPPHGGIEIDYQNWCKEYSDSITRAWTIPEYQGIGTIGLAYVKDNETVIFPTETERSLVRAWIIEHLDSSVGKYVGIPITAEPGFFVIGLTPYTIDMTIQIYPNTSAVRTAITAKIEELIEQKGAPGGTIYISEFYESITSAAGELRSKIITPSSDVAVSTIQLHQLGTITFQDYV